MVVASKKEPSACEEIKRLNHNVRLILVIVLFAGLSESLGFGSALSAYLFKITGKENINVGYLESAMGITKLLTALPVGSISDKYGRAPVGRVGSFAYTAASAMTAYCLVANAMSRGGSDDDGRGKADDDDDDDANDSNEGLNSKMFALWAVALCLWGFGRGVVDGPVLALFADSVPTGDRARFYLYLFYVFWAGALAGPVAAVGIFSAQRDEWTYRELSVVLVAALAFKMVNAVLLASSATTLTRAEAEHVRLPGNDDDDDDEDGEGSTTNTERTRSRRSGSSRPQRTRTSTSPPERAAARERGHRRRRRHARHRLGVVFLRRTAAAAAAATTPHRLCRSRLRGRAWAGTSRTSSSPPRSWRSSGRA